MSLFKKKSYGLDIRDQSIKCFELVKDGRIFKIGKFRNYTLPDGVIRDGEIIDNLKLRDILSGIRKVFNFTEAYISFPKEKIYDVVRAAKIIPLGFENSDQSAARSLVSREGKSTYMLVDLGKHKTIISVIYGGEVCYSKNIDMGSYILEEMIEHGWSANLFFDLINKHYISWHIEEPELIRSKSGLISDPKRQIQKIILYGDSPFLLHAAEHLTMSMRVKVELGNVWTNIIKSFDEYLPEMVFEESLGYATAVGLTLKNFEKIIK